MNANDLLRVQRAKSRERMQISTANRYKAQRTVSGEFEGIDGSTNESIFRLPNGETIRTEAINTSYAQPGQFAPIRIPQSGSAVSDGKHSNG